MYLGADYFDEADLTMLGYCGVDGDNRQLVDYQNYCDPGFGRYVPSLGILPAPYLVEVDQTDDIGMGYVKTPMIEFNPLDYAWLAGGNAPYRGMRGVGDNGDLYEYVWEQDGTLGGLRSFFKKAKKKIKKGIKNVGSKVKKAMTKTKFGRAVVKIGGKVKDTFNKVVKPMAKKFGPWMVRLAPMANAIPGVGPLVSKAMTATGKMGMAMNKFDSVAQKVKAVARGNGSIMDVVKVATKNPMDLTSNISDLANQFKKLPKSKLKEMASRLDKINPDSPAGKRLFPTREPSLASKSAAVKLSRLAQKDNALAYARNRSNPATQRRRAMAHAAKMAALNRRSIAQTARAEMRTPGATPIAARAAAAARARSAQQRAAAASRASAAQTRTAIARSQKVSNLARQIAALQAQMRALQGGKA